MAFSTLDETIYNTADGRIQFSFHSQENFSEFYYNWKYIVTGNTGKILVYCRNYNKFLELLEYWNSQGFGVWVYWEDSPLTE